MFYLEDEDDINCVYCGTIMKEIQLCKSRSNHYSQTIGPFKKRCHSIVCKDCEYCFGCEDNIQRYKKELKRNRYGKKDEDKEVCKQIIKELKDRHDITLE